MEYKIDVTIWKESQSDNYRPDQNSEKQELTKNNKIFGPTKVGVVWPARPTLKNWKNWDKRINVLKC